MSDKNTGDWFNKHKFIIVVVVMLLIWGSLLSFFWLKTEEITNDPCAICSQRLGEDVTCVAGNYLLNTVVFYPNKSVKLTESYNYETYK